MKLALVVGADNNTGGAGRLTTALVVVQADPVPRSINTTTALMFDWNSTTGRAVLIFAVVETSGRPEGVVVGVEGVLVGESVLDELNIALEQFTFAGTVGIVGNKVTELGSVLPCVADKLAIALVAMFGTDTLLAVLVGFALVVKSIDGTTLAHLGHGAIAEQEAVATVGPVLAVVELVLASHALLVPVLLGNALQVIVATLSITIIASGDGLTRSLTLFGSGSGV